MDQRRRQFFSRLLFLICMSQLPSLVSAQNTLFNQTSIVTGNSPSSAIVADFNSDGRPDLAVANQTDNTVSVILSKADGTYAPKVDYKVGAGPIALTSADFNGDHIPDLAVVNSDDNTISILLGNGNGGFSSQVTYPTGAQPFGIVAVDLNSDNKVDLAVMNSLDGTMSIFLGNGDGTFGGESTISVGRLPTAIVSGDINGDGITDLSVLSSQGALSLLINDGTGHFSTKSITVGEGGAGLAVGDFNNDGRLDIVVPDPVLGQLVVLLGTDSGGFQTISNPFNVNLNKSVTVGDFNDDGQLDVALGRDGSIQVFMGRGDGTFQQPLNYGFPGVPIALLAADLNSDNYLDLAALKFGGNAVTILYGDGRGNFGGSFDILMPLSGEIGGAAAADFNGDGRVDVGLVQMSIIGQGSNGISVIPGNGDGTFQTTISTPVSGLGPEQMIAGDFNGDGKTDIAASSMPIFGEPLFAGLSIVLGNGDGTFGPPIANAVNLPGLNIQTTIAGDFNNDGKQDLAMFPLGNSGGPLYVLLSNGDGTFQPNLIATIPGLAMGLAAGDFNHDGNLGLAIAEEDPTLPSLLVFLGRGDGTFSSPTSYGTAMVSTYSVSAADFNGDGNIDLAVGTQQGMFVFLEKGDGTFQVPINTPTPNINGTGGAFSGDFNGDGKPDLMILGQGRNQEILLGNGDGTFQDGVNFPPTYTPSPASVAVGDFNGDGSQDLVQFSSLQSVIGDIAQVATIRISAPTVVFSSSKLDFRSQNAGTSAGPEPILLTNIGNAPLSISSIAVNGDFNETNNCPRSLPAGQACSVEVTFTGTRNGLSDGNLTFTDNATSRTQKIPSSGWAGPADFAISAAPGSSTATAGGTASYTVTLTAMGGFNGTVQLGCAGTPAKATCTLSPSSVALTESSTVAVLVSTVAPLASNLSHRDHPTSRWSLLALCFFVPFTGLLSVKRKQTMGLFGASALLWMLLSCGGGGNAGSSGEGITPGTPPGSYNLVVSATSGSSTHSVAIGLSVKTP